MASQCGAIDRQQPALAGEGECDRLAEAVTKMARVRDVIVSDGAGDGAGMHGCVDEGAQRGGQCGKVNSAVGLQQLAPVGVGLRPIIVHFTNVEVERRPRRLVAVDEPLRCEGQDLLSERQLFAADRLRHIPRQALGGGRRVS